MNKQIKHDVKFYLPIQFYQPEAHHGYNTLFHKIFREQLPFLNQILESIMGGAMTVSASDINGKYLIAPAYSHMRNFALTSEQHQRFTVGVDLVDTTKKTSNSVNVYIYDASGKRHNVYLDVRFGNNRKGGIFLPVRGVTLSKAAKERGLHSPYVPKVI